MKTRRGPWLSGLIVALSGAVWMIGQVVGGVVSMVSGLLPVDMPGGTKLVALAQLAGAHIRRYHDEMYRFIGGSCLSSVDM